MQLQAIDISSWQHPGNEPINWQDVVTAGYHGVLIKATQGNWYTSPNFHQDYEDAHNAGLVVGAYHYAEPGRTSPDDQAAYFHGVIAGCTLELGLWLDLEETGGLLDHDLSTWAEGWIKAIDTPQNPAGAYLNVDYANRLPQIVQGYRLWLANPSNITNTFKPLIVQTGQGTVPGIVGATDLDTVTNARPINPPGGGGVAVPAPPAPPVEPPKDSGEPELKQGDHGQAVTQLQVDLNGHGAHLAEDGTFGPATHEAVVAFQGDNGLAVDGVVGPLTWAALRPATAKPVAPVPGAEPELQEGASGDAVTLAQRLLNETGFALTVDGQYGPNTRSAVTSFQLAHDLAADGILGPNTWAALRDAT